MPQHRKTLKIKGKQCRTSEKTWKQQMKTMAHCGKTLITEGDHAPASKTIEK